MGYAKLSYESNQLLLVDIRAVWAHVISHRTCKGQDDADGRKSKIMIAHGSAHSAEMAGTIYNMKQAMSSTHTWKLYNWRVRVWHVDRICGFDMKHIKETESAGFICKTQKRRNMRVWYEIRKREGISKFNMENIKHTEYVCLGLWIRVYDLCGLCLGFRVCGLGLGFRV